MISFVKLFETIYSTTAFLLKLSKKTWQITGKNFNKFSLVTAEMLEKAAPFPAAPLQSAEICQLLLCALCCPNITSISMVAQDKLLTPEEGTAQTYLEIGDVGPDVLIAVSYGTKL